MPKYMLVLRDDPKQFASMSPSEMQAVLEKFGAWASGLAAQGRLVGGHKLQDDGGRTMRKVGARVTSKDGPFVETKEIVSGYFIISADDYDHAVKLCDDHPIFSYDGLLEIRAVDFMGQPET
ncbi:MAG: YciI family protein [Planctomycetota bacterium]|nr:YciI family protein [Planctomycetota bacterium]